MKVTLRAARYNAAKYDKERGKLVSAAKAAGVSVNTLTSYERGDTCPRMDTLAKLCEYYKCNMSDIDLGKNFAQSTQLN